MAVADLRKKTADVSDALRNLMLQHKNSGPFRQNYPGACQRAADSRSRRKKVRKKVPQDRTEARESQQAADQLEGDARTGA